MLEKKELANGVSFVITEHSRVIAADRWYVKVVGMVTMPLAAADWSAIADDDPAMQARVKRHLGEVLEHQMIKDRNFVDAAAKEAVVKELVGQLLETVGDYLAVESFPARLLARKYQEAREICCIEVGREGEVADGAEEPVDFSHCFK